jgi:hypothetical protein
VRPPSHDTVTSQVPSLFSLICTTDDGREVSAIGAICARFPKGATPGSSPALFKPDPLPSDLTHSLDYGDTFAQTASFLRRDEDEVRQKARQLGLVEHPGRRLKVIR